jgi:hypothetical protein
VGQGIKVCATQDLFSGVGLHSQLLAVKNAADENEKRQRSR